MEVRFWSLEADAVLTKLWGEGRSASEIGKVLGVTKNAVLGRKQRMGLPLHNSKVAPGPAWSPHELETFTRLWNSGVSRAYISEQLNRSLPAICNMRARLGLPPRSTGGQPGPRRPSTRCVRQPRPLQPITTQAPPAATEPKPCQYPVSGEGRRTQFCNEDVKVGSPYCPAHHYLCNAGVKWAPTPGGNQIDNGPLCQRRPAAMCAGG